MTLALRLLVLLCHLHPDAATPLRLRVGLNVTDRDLRAAGDQLVTAHLARRQGSTWTPTGRGCLYAQQLNTAAQVA